NRSNSANITSLMKPFQSSIKVLNTKQKLIPNIQIPKNNYQDPKSYLSNSPHIEMNTGSRFNTNWWFTGQNSKITQNEMREIIVQKEKWQKKYIDLSNKMSILQEKFRKENFGEKTEDFEKMSEEKLIFKAIELCEKADRYQLVKSLSTSDLRQSAIIKCVLANRKAIEMICLSLA
ncbi:hypothetical protein MHBO_004475, partial [Bonamia ostreae]